jgi:hypothetical protein
MRMRKWYTYLDMSGGVQDYIWISEGRGNSYLMYYGIIKYTSG